MSREGWEWGGGQAADRRFKDSRERAARRKRAKEAGDDGEMKEVKEIQGGRGCEDEWMQLNCDCLWWGGGRRLFPYGCWSIGSGLEKSKVSSTVTLVVGFRRRWGRG